LNISLSSFFQLKLGLLGTFLHQVWTWLEGVALDWVGLLSQRAVTSIDCRA
jgi:hypothetical protein